MPMIFSGSAAGEKEVTRAILNEWTRKFEANIASDVLIAGAGPSGLVCVRELARRKLRVAVIESINYLGGGFWIGGYLMNKVTIRAPVQTLLEELGVPLVNADNGLYVADGPHACSKLIASSCDAGVTFLNMTCVGDVVLRENRRVAGLVTIGMAVSSTYNLPRIGPTFSAMLLSGMKGAQFIMKKMSVA